MCGHARKYCLEQLGLRQLDSDAGHNLPPYACLYIYIYICNFPIMLIDTHSDGYMTSVGAKELLSVPTEINSQPSAGAKRLEQMQTISAGSNRDE